VDALSRGRETLRLLPEYLANGWRMEADHSGKYGSYFGPISLQVNAKPKDGFIEAPSPAIPYRSLKELLFVFPSRREESDQVTVEPMIPSQNRY